MFKKIMAALSAFILAGCLYADAEDLVIDGLGKLSFGEDVQITDGGGSRAETIFKKSGHRKDYGKTDQEIRYPRHLFRFRLCCERNGRSLLSWETGKGCPVLGARIP